MTRHAIIFSQVSKWINSHRNESPPLKSPSPIHLYTTMTSSLLNKYVPIFRLSRWYDEQSSLSGVSPGCLFIRTVSRAPIFRVRCNCHRQILTLPSKIKNRAHLFLCSNDRKTPSLQEFLHLFEFF